MGAGCIALSASTAIALSWPSSNPDDVPTEGLARREPYVLWFVIWVYCIIWFFIQDSVKVYFWRYMKSINMFGINNTGKADIDSGAAKKETEVSYNPMGPTA